MSEMESAKLVTAIIAAVASLLGALIGGGITGTITYITARQNRLGALEQDRHKARRERHTARVASFLAVVDRRIHDYASVAAAVNQGDPDEYRDAVLQAGKDDLFTNSAIMPLARRQNAFGAALKNFLAAERNARRVLEAIVVAEAKSPSITPESLAAVKPLARQLEEAQSRLSVAIADLYDAVDDYLDGPHDR